MARFGSWLACCLGRGERAPIGPTDVAELAAEVGAERYERGTFVFREGEVAARVHVVREGVVELSRDLAGRRRIIQLLHAGDVFGDVPLLLGEPEPFDARAVEDSVVLSLDAVTLFGLLARRPALMRRWMVSLAGRMSGLQRRLIDVLAGDLETQLASALLGAADDLGRARLSQAQLAAMLGVQRTSVQRTLKRLEQAGLVAIGYRQVELLDAAGLASLLAGTAQDPTP